MKKKLCLLLSAAFMVVSLSGCAVVRYLLTGDWNGDANLVVVSQNPIPIGLHRPVSGRREPDDGRCPEVWPCWNGERATA